MAPKRKRDEPEDEGGESTPTLASRPSFGETSSSPATPSLAPKRPKVDPNSLRIVWQLADGSDNYSHRLGEHDTLNDAMYHMNKRLDISTPGDVRLAQVRDMGREVDICDDFDYQALKDRALAGRSGGSVVVNVYPGYRAYPALPQQNAGQSTSAPSTRDRARQGSSWTTPRAMQTPGHSPTTARLDTQTHSAYPGPAYMLTRATPQSPTASPAQSLTRKQRKREKNKARKRRESRDSDGPHPFVQGVHIPVVQTDHKSPRGSNRQARRELARSAPEGQSPLPRPDSASQAAMPTAKFEQYKPVKPSPLGQALPDESSPTPSVARSDFEVGSLPSNALELSETTTTHINKDASPATDSADTADDTVIGPAPSLVLPGGNANDTLQTSTAIGRDPVPTSTADANVRIGRSPSPPSALPSPPHVASPFDLTTGPTTAVPHRQRSDRSATPALDTTMTGQQTPTASSSKSLALASSWNLVHKPKGTKAPQLRSSSELGLQRPRKLKAGVAAEPAAEANGKTPSEDAVDPAINATSEEIDSIAKSATSSTADVAVAESRVVTPTSEPTPAKATKPRGRKKTAVVVAPPEPALDLAATATGQNEPSAGDTPISQVDVLMQDTNPDAPAADSAAIEAEKPVMKRGRSAKEVAKEKEPKKVKEPKTPVKRGPKKGTKAPTTADQHEAAAQGSQAEVLPANVDGRESAATAAEGVLERVPGDAAASARIPETATNDYFTPAPAIDLPEPSAPTAASANTGTVIDASAPIELPGSPASDTSSHEADERVEAFISGMSPPPGMKEGGPIENAILAGRVACIICQKSPTHLEKDCPLVKAGLDALRETLEARRSELKSWRGRKSSLERGKMQMVLSMLRRSIDTITAWIKRLEDLEQRRNAVRSPAATTDPTIRPTGTNASATPAQNGNGRAEHRSRNSSPSDREEEPPAQTAGESKKTPFPPTPDTGSHSAGVHMIDLLHQKALRMGRQHPSRAISSSGLSASDAIIETASSGSESDSDSIQSGASSSSSDPSSSSSSGSSTATTTPLDAITGEAGGSDAEADGEGSEPDGERERITSLPNGLKDLSAASEDGDDEGGGSDVEMRSNSSQSTASPSSSSSVSTSSSASASSRSTRSPSPASPSPIGDPESSFLHFLKKPLSVKEKRRARVSAASMPASQDVMDVDEIVVDDQEESEDENDIVPSGRAARRGSDSSIDVGVDDEMDAQSDIIQATQSQPPAVEPDYDGPVTIADAQAMEGTTGESTSVPLQAELEEFKAAEPDAVYSPPQSSATVMQRPSMSPVVGGTDGDSALRAAADDEAPPVASQSPEKPARHIISQGLPSPISSQDGQLPATQLMTETPVAASVPNKRRGRPPKLALTSSNHSQSSAASQETPSLVPESSQLSPDLPNSQDKASRSPVTTRGRSADTRRPKSVGFEIADTESAQTPKRLTRGSAALQANGPVQEVTAPPSKLDTSSPLTSVLTVTTPAGDAVNGDDSVPRVTGAAATEPAIEDAESNSLPNGVMTQRTQSTEASQSDETAKTTVPPSPRTATRRSGRTQRSPSLFLSQGSQGLATQKYSTAFSSSQSQAPASLTNGRRAASPIPEDDELESEKRDQDSPLPEDSKHAEESDDGAHSDSGGSSSGEDVDIPLLRPAIISRRSASADPTNAKIAVPSLGSLDTAMLRNPHARRSVPATQPTPRSKAMVEESESDSSSSDDEPTPAARKGRYATGKTKPARKLRASGSVTGW